ncbi:hypothetical protein HAX54_005640, partial [Datura stramonium]|nr:hypothetical protein [Datura stramonium]
MESGVSTVRFSESPIENWFTFKIDFKPLSGSRVTLAVHESRLEIRWLIADIPLQLPNFLLRIGEQAAIRGLLLRLVSASPTQLVLLM